MTTIADNTLLFETTAAGFSTGDFLVQRIDGYESLSTPYEFHVMAQCQLEGGVSPDAADEILSSTAYVGIGPSGSHHISGVVREIEQVDISMDGQLSLYRIVLVPRFWQATLTRRTRAFNEMSVPDVIGAVLVEMGWASGTDFDLRLNGTYNPREYIVQYEETDFAFLSRWMERLGMYYWFEQADDVDKLVISDANNAFTAAPEHDECTYSADEHAALGGIHHLRRLTTAMPARVYERDYNWRTPARPVWGQADVDAAHGFGLQAFNGDHFKDNGEGASMAQLRAEGFLARKEVYTAHSSNYDFAPGARFTLSGSPVGELDQEYVITRVVHSGAQDSRSAGMGAYSNEIEAIPFATQYRAPRVTPWPRIDGVIYGKIDAASVSSAAPIDDQGRYRVAMSCDLYGSYGGTASRWVRKAEPYAGPEYGMHMTLHVGADVLIAHVGGDPDRPVIVGSLPNPSMGTPITASNATRSGIRTRSGIMIDLHDDAA